MERAKKGQHMGTPDIHYVSQVMKININSASHVHSMYPKYDVMKMVLNFCDLPPKIPHKPSPVMRKKKNSEKYQLRDILQNISPVLHTPQTCQGNKTCQGKKREIREI